MRNSLYIIFAALIFVASAWAENKKEPAPENNNTDTAAVSDNQNRKVIKLTEIWRTPKEFSVPESVYFDYDRDVLYVSNINGKPDEKNGKGFISKLKTDGTIDSLQWVLGLNAPKGMGLKGNILFVADIDRLVAIDVDQGFMLDQFPAEGAKFLNDVAIDDDGNVYVSDTETNRIYKYFDGKIEPWIEINHPNGLRYFNGDLYAGSYETGDIFKIDIEKKSYQKVSESHHGIDGLIPLDSGGFIVSDWAGIIDYIDPKGYVTDVINTKDQDINAADLEFMYDRNVLLVPTFFDGRIVAYKVEM